MNDIRQLIDEHEASKSWLQRLKEKIALRKWRAIYKIELIRKRLFGISTVIGTACKCNHCHATNYMYRAGCRCWPAGQFLNPSDQYSMQYGVYVVLPDNSETVFLSHNDLRIAIKSGGKYEDRDGKSLMLDDLDSDE